MKSVRFRIALAAGITAATSLTACAAPPAAGESLALARDDSLQQQLSPLKPASGEYLDLNKNGQKDPYEDPALPIERRIDDLLSRMSVEEKTCQMATLYGYLRVLKDDLPKPAWKTAIWKDGIANIDEHINGYQGGRGVDMESGVSDNNPNVWPASAHAKALNEVQRWFIEQTRLGIPVDFSNEGIRGLAHLKATCFPSQNAMGATWDRKLVRRQGEITAIEGRALGYTNIYSPICDVSRDQRWGRNEDTYGEAPYLVGELAVQAVQGLQANGVASTVKHYTIYSVTKGAREGQARVDPQVAPREADDILVYPFKRAFRDGGAMGVMSSYNDYDGVPISGSHYWLTDRLRGEFGFRGYICSDSDAVEYLYTKHHVAADMKDAVRQVVEAGLNVRCTFSPPDVYIKPLRELIRENKLSISVIDARVRDVLRVKYQLGLFDRPYVDPKKADELVMKPEHLAAALQASRESVVLLKNDPKDQKSETKEKDAKKSPSLLPLNKALKKVLVCGPNAEETQYALSRYGPFNVPVTTVLAGVKAKLQGTGTAVTYVKGCDTVDPGFPQSEILPEPISDKERQGIEEAAAAANGADVAIIVCGDGKKTSGEHKARTSLELPGRQLDLIKAVHATGTPVVLVLINGRPQAINWPAAHVPAIICANYPGAQGGTAIADVLFGDYNPGGKLTNTWPRSVGQIPYNFPAKPNSQWESEKAANVAGAIYYFGHGLSYTTFEYSNLRIHPESGEKFTTSGNVVVEVDVKNIGQREGDEVVQLYHRDLVSSVTTYELNLSGFERVNLKPGESKTAKFTVVPEQLSLINRDNKRVVEPGEFKFWVGASSRDLKLDKTVKLAE